MELAKPPSFPFPVLMSVIVFGFFLLSGCRSDRSSSPGPGGVLESLARPHKGRSMRATSTMRVGELRRGPEGDRNSGERRYDPAADPRGDSDVQSNWDNFNVPPGATHVLLDAKGPGIITHIWITFLGPEPEDWAPQGSANHQELMLRMSWDGNPRPAVEAPVGDFFANCFGRRAEVISLPVIVEDADSYNCFWHMPFWKSARIEIENQSQKPLSLLYFNIDWIKLDSLPQGTPYFYAQYRQEYPARNGRDYLLLETTGKGHYVGSVLAVRMRSPSWFGEGDEKIYIDGEAKPSIWGTGTEDYFLSAWGLQMASTPYFGVPYYDEKPIDGHTSAYRWHLHDPIVFNKGIKVTLEHRGWISFDENPEYKSTSWNEREDDYASVAFWYQTGIPTFAERAPGAHERRLPSLERVVVRARDFIEAKRHGEGEAMARAGGEGGEVLVYRPERQAAAWLEFPVEVKAKEPLRLTVSGSCSPEGGRYQALLDGVKIGRPLDFYADEHTAREFPLLDFWPDPGAYLLRLECVGRDARSAGYACAIDSVRLLERRPRVAQYGHDKDKDWRKNPLLYE
ncbi:MAG: glycoside hydrolase family 172 protein [Acidobacteriota bacterium]